MTDPIDAVRRAEVRDLWREVMSESPEKIREASAEQHLDAAHREWRIAVSGYEARAERLRAERREEIVGGLPFETEMGPSVTKCD